MKREMRTIAKKISEMEINRSRSSLNSNAGSEMSIASSTRSEPSIERKVTMHDQWLKDLDLRLQMSDTATIDGTLIWKITEYSRRLDENPRCTPNPMVSCLQTFSWFGADQP